jgi:hypothetical protein
MPATCPDRENAVKKSLPLLLIVLAACADREADGAAPEVADAGEMIREAKAEAKSARKQRAPKWRFEYSGDLNGSVEGTILTMMVMQAGGSPRYTLAGGAMAPDLKSQATESFNGTVMTLGDSTTTTIRVVLADGTQCHVDGVEPTKFRVLDDDKKTFHAELSGSLRCGEARATFDAVFNKDPGA